MASAAVTITGPLTVQVVDDFVPGRGVLGYEVIDLLRNTGEQSCAVTRLVSRLSGLASVFWHVAKQPRKLQQLTGGGKMCDESRQLSCSGAPR